MSKSNVNNVPKYANDYSYWVAREVDGELWFWGAYNEQARAYGVADEVDGVVVGE